MMVYFVDKNLNIIEEVKDLSVIPRIGELVSIGKYEDSRHMYKVISVHYAREGVPRQWSIDIKVE